MTSVTSGATSSSSSSAFGGFGSFGSGASSSSSSAFGGFGAGATSSSSSSAFGGFFGSFGFGATSSSSSSSAFGGFGSFGATSSSSSAFGGFGSFGASSSSSAGFGGHPPGSAGGFIPSPFYNGPMEGMVFTTSFMGTGYYPDTAAAAAADPSQGASSSSSAFGAFGSFGFGTSSSSSAFGGFGSFGAGATSSSSSSSAFGGFGSFGATSSSSSAFGGFGSFGATSSSSSAFGGFGSFGFAGASSSSSAFGGFGSFGDSSSLSAPGGGISEAFLSAADSGGFIPSPSYNGPMHGMVFTTSVRGTGYYSDTAAEAVPSEGAFASIVDQDERGFRPFIQGERRRPASQPSDQPVQFGGSTFGGFGPGPSGLGSFNSGGFATGIGFTPYFGTTDQEIPAPSEDASVDQGVQEPKFQAGGPDSKVYAEELFESPPPLPLICMVCKGVPFPKEVRRCTICDRTACSLCHSTRMGGTCSACGGRPSNIGGWKEGSTPSLNFLLDQLAFKCPNGGCEHRVEQGGSHSMEGHLATCPLQAGSCLACHAELTRGEFGEHEGECPFRRVGCSHCGEQVPHSDLGEHEEGCSLRPIPCPHKGCGEVVAQGDAGVHRQECPFRPLNCPLCSQSFVGEEALEDHLNQGDDHGHVRALVKVTKGMQEEIDSLKLMVAELQKQTSNKGPCGGHYPGTNSPKGNWGFSMG